jgi:hypothetical protein
MEKVMKAGLARICKDNSFWSLGDWTVIRFNDADVKVDMNNVLMAIEGWIERNNPLPPFSKGELPTQFEKEP